jgi:hypothetical protein
MREDIMKDKNKHEQIPAEFASYEEAAEFWDSHDTTDYLDEFVTVNVKTNFRKRYDEVEIEDEVAKVLKKRAHDLGISTRRLASDLLRAGLTS